MENLKELIQKSNKVYSKNHDNTAWFERAIFFSWYCKIADCKYCYMSTLEAKPNARRSTESILAEVLICKLLGWKIGSIAGGHEAYTQVEFKTLLQNIHKTLGEKVWVNAGALTKEEIEDLRPYIKGVIGAIEIINPKLHKEICPSKTIESMEEMFESAEGLKKGMTMIIGLGETIEDFELLEKFIKKHKLDKIHYYSLNPQKGTIYENKKSPSKEYQSEWISKTRIAFPKLDIQAGIWKDKVENVSFLLKSGANSITKFPAIRLFNSTPAKQIEEQAKKAGRDFKGSLTNLPEIDIEKELSKISLDEELKQKIKPKLERYLKTMQKVKK